MEVDEILRGAEVILHLTAFDQELRKLNNRQVINLSPQYFTAPDAALTYAELAETIRQAANDNTHNGYVCFVTYGHPLMLVDTSWYLLNSAGLKTKAIAATSFIDAVLCDSSCRFDSSVQYYESNVFMELKPNIDPRFPLILSQVGEVGSTEIGLRSKKIEWLTPLFQEISRIYNPTDLCELIFSPYRPDMPPMKTIVSVAEISTLVPSVHVGSTLLVYGEKYAVNS